MLREEQIVRECLAQWASLDGTIAAFEAHHHPDIVWWNAGRGAVRGNAQCIEGVKAMHSMLDVGRVEVVIGNVLAEPGRVIVERHDDLYKRDGTLIASVPVVGVFEFDGEKIVELRDYCADWMRDLAPA